MHRPPPPLNPLSHVRMCKIFWTPFHLIKPYVIMVPSINQVVLLAGWGYHTVAKNGPHRGGGVSPENCARGLWKPHKGRLKRIPIFLRLMIKWRTGLEWKMLPYRRRNQIQTSPELFSVWLDYTRQNACTRHPGNCDSARWEKWMHRGDKVRDVSEKWQ